MMETELIKLKKEKTVITAFNEYTLKKQVGQGGNGTVWEASDRDNTIVAIKFIERDSKTRTLKRFKNEALFCMKNEHKNIIQIKDYGTVNDQYIFYVMPLYKDTLRDKMKQGIASKDALDIFVGILKGLEYAHKKEVIHRDIKPENILFQEDSNEPIIADFGIAHFSSDNLATMIKTKAGERMANFQYAAPEQRMKGKEALPQSDVYAAALILNEMFTKEIPQAAGYREIASIDEEYAFLDKVFEKINVQDPEKRLYPESAIFMEINAQRKVYEKENQIKRLENIEVSLENPAEYNPSITNIEYENGSIIFELDTKINRKWLDILCAGHFGHNSFLEYDTYKLNYKSYTKLEMPVRKGENKDTIVNTAKYVKEWILNASIIYNNQIKNEQEELKRKREAERIQEIEKNKNEISVNSMLSDLV